MDDEVLFFFWIRSKKKNINNVAIRKKQEGRIRGTEKDWCGRKVSERNQRGICGAIRFVGFRHADVIFKGYEYGATKGSRRWPETQTEPPVPVQLLRTSTVFEQVGFGMGVAKRHQTAHAKRNYYGVLKGECQFPHIATVANESTIDRADPMRPCSRASFEKAQRHSLLKERKRKTRTIFGFSQNARTFEGLHMRLTVYDI